MKKLSLKVAIPLCIFGAVLGALIYHLVMSAFL